MPLRNEWVALRRLRSSCANLPSRKLFRRRCPVLQRKPEPCPHIHGRLGETIGERIVVAEALPIRRRLTVAGIFIGRS